MKLTRDKRVRSVVIFGGAGFIGSNLAYSLLADPQAHVHVFDNLSRPGVRHNLAWLEQTAAGSGRLQFTCGDVRDAGLVERIAQDADEIYHFAAQVAVTKSLENPREDFEVNLGGTFNVLEAARKSGRQPFVLFTLTNKVYGSMPQHAIRVNGNRCEYETLRGISEEQPIDLHSPYGCSKGSADQYVRDYARIYGLPTVVFRMSCIAGPRQFGTEDQGWVAHFLYSAMERRPVVIYGDGRQVRDVLNVHDLIAAFSLAREYKERTAGEIYNLGGGPANTLSLLELVDTIELRTGRAFEFRYEPARSGDQPVYVTDTAKFERDTGWLAHRTVAETIDEIWQFRRTNSRLFSGFAESIAESVVEESITVSAVGPEPKDPHTTVARVLSPQLSPAVGAGHGRL